MKLIVLTGLVSIEKIDLTNELAQHYLQAGYSVTILDNITRLALDSETAPVPPQRIDGDITQQLADRLTATNSEIVILAASETMNPDTLFTGLALLDVPDLTIETWALIDLRTCDCFPNVREKLEAYADHVVMLPYEMDDILSYADTH